MLIGVLSALLCPNWGPLQAHPGDPRGQRCHRSAHGAGRNFSRRGTAAFTSFSLYTVVTHFLAQLTLLGGFSVCWCHVVRRSCNHRSGGGRGRKSPMCCTSPARARRVVALLKVDMLIGMVLAIQSNPIICPAHACPMPRLMHVFRPRRTKSCTPQRPVPPASAGCSAPSSWYSWLELWPDLNHEAFLSPTHVPGHTPCRVLHLLGPPPSGY